MKSVISKIFLMSLTVASSFNLSASDVRYGVCAHLNRWEYDCAQQELELMNKIGIESARADLDWNQVEPQKGKWDFTKWDNVISTAKHNNVQMLPILTVYSTYTNGSPVENDNLKDWQNYVKTCVERYKDSLPYWEVVNEPNLESFWRSKPDGKAYATALKAASTTIRKIAPEAKILYAGLAGIPHKFLKDSFANGAMEHFDIMNVHPYQWRSLPESNLARELQELRQLLDENGGKDKKIWITEIGNSTGTYNPAISKLIERAIERTGLELDKIEVAEISDLDYLYSTSGIRGDARRLIPSAKKIKKITFEKLKNLDATKTPVLLLSGSESYPHSQLEGLYNYIASGGTVVSPGGFMFYYDIVEQANGELKDTPKGAIAHKMFHIALTPSQNMPKLPKRNYKEYESGEHYKDIKIDGKFGLYSPSSINLKDGDKMEVLFYGKNEGEKYPLGALYRFNSDLKGNIIMLAPFLDEVVSEEVQSKLIPRTLIICFANGVDRVHTYNFRDNENDYTRESHFGLVRRDLTPKPSYTSYAVLRKMLGKSKVEMSRINKYLYKATWQRDDGKFVTAVWTPIGKHKATLTLKTPLEEIVTNTGDTKPIKAKTTLTYTFTDSLTYLIGVQSFL